MLKQIPVDIEFEMMPAYMSFTGMGRFIRKMQGKPIDVYVGKDIVCKASYAGKTLAIKCRIPIDLEDNLEYIGIVCNQLEKEIVKALIGEKEFLRREIVLLEEDLNNFGRIPCPDDYASIQIERSQSARLRFCLMKLQDKYRLLYGEEYDAEIEEK